MACPDRGPGEAVVVASGAATRRVDGADSTDRCRALGLNGGRLIKGTGPGTLRPYEGHDDTVLSTERSDRRDDWPPLADSKIDSNEKGSA